MRSASARCSEVKNGVVAIKRSIWSAPAERSGDGALDLMLSYERLIIVQYLQLICFESVDSLHLCGPRGSFEPSCRTPRILICYVNQPMLNRILMYIVKSGKIRVLMCKLYFPEIVPHFTAC